MILVVADVGRAFEHHVLKHVGKARATGGIIRPAGVIPDVHCDHRSRVVFGQDDAQPVGQGVIHQIKHVILEVDLIRRRFPCRSCPGQRQA